MLTRASARPGAPGDRIALVSRVCDDLHAQLSLWVGKEGVVVLLRRALVIAFRDHPALDSVSIAPVETGCFKGVDRAVDQYDADAVFEGLLAALIAFITLLGRFLGENLTTAMLEKNWPQSDDSPRAGERSADHDG